MLHGKKMMLVPHETIEQVQSSLPSAPAPVGSYSKMDSDMEKILNDKKMSEFDKWVQYDSVLQRYMSKLSRQRKDVQILFDEDDDEILPVQTPIKVEAHTFHPNFSSDIKNVKSGLLYNILKKAANVELPSDGSLMINGNIVGKINELISATQLPKLESLPEGWKQFSLLLKNLALPPSYVSNKELVKYLKSLPSDRLAIPRRGRSQKALRWAPYNGPSQ
jgi:hypothetical protein